MAEHVLTFHDGRVGAIYDDAIGPLLRELGPTVTRRATHVEPWEDGWAVWITGWVRRAAAGQHCWGLVCPDIPRMAENLLGPFPTRAAALAAERRYLEAVL